MSSLKRNQQNANISVKVFFATLKFLMLEFGARDIQIQTPNETHMVFQSCSEHNTYVAHICCGPEIQAWISGSPFLCFQVLIARWSPKVSKWRQHECEITRFGQQNWQHPLPKSLLIAKQVKSKLHTDTRLEKHRKHKKQQQAELKELPVWAKP